LVAKPGAGAPAIAIVAVLALAVELENNSTGKPIETGYKFAVLFLLIIMLTCFS
jgi:hypothetical protein